MLLKRSYKIDWVSINQLAISRAPQSKKDLDLLKNEGIKSVLSLCSDKEVSIPSIIKETFNHRSFILPDHSYGRAPTINETQNALFELEELIRLAPPVLVHCVAGVERSPLICMAWLIKNKSLNTPQALDYMMQVHPGTNPLSSQLKVLDKLFI
tara:strand:+ start:548 stop:1009 length:462 start_codon:yes stop_codon:yes gene_type:complete